MVSEFEDGFVLQLKRIIVIISFIHNGGVLAYHLFKKRQNSKNRTKALLFVLSKVVLFSIVFQNILAIHHAFATVILQDNSLIHCQIIGRINAFLLGVSKFALYFLFLERLFAIFRGNLLRFSKKQICIARIYYLVMLMLTSVFVFILMRHTKHPYDEFSCITSIPIPILGFIILNDITLTAMVSILFMRRLIAINNISAPKQRESNPDIDVDLFNLLKKTALLAFVALLSSQIAFLLCGVFTFIKPCFLRIDSMVNCWCVILLFHKHGALYKKCCIQTNIEKKCTGIKCLLFCSCHYCCKINLLFESEKKNESENETKMDKMETNKNCPKLGPEDKSCSVITSQNGDVSDVESVTEVITKMELCMVQTTSTVDIAFHE